MDGLFLVSVCPLFVCGHTSLLSLCMCQQLRAPKHIERHLPAHGIPDVFENRGEPRSICSLRAVGSTSRRPSYIWLRPKYCSTMYLFF